VIVACSFLSSPIVSTLCYFFFQAEDGIRDFHVTGVQTCALPIWHDFSEVPPSLQWLAERVHVTFRGTLIAASLCGRHVYRPADEIGRASCRERVGSSVGADARKKKMTQPVE